MLRIIALVDPTDVRLTVLDPRQVAVRVTHRCRDFIDLVSGRGFDVAFVVVRKRSAWTVEFEGEVQPHTNVLRTLPIPLVLACDESLAALRFAIWVAKRRYVQLAVIRPNGALDGANEAVSAAAGTLAGMRIYASLINLRPMIERSPLQHVIESVLLHPEQFADEAAGIRRLGASTTMVNEWLRSQALGSLRVLRRAARTAGAFHLAKSHRLPLKQIAARLGCGSIDTLQREIQRVTGYSLTRLSAIRHETEIIEQATRYCLSSEAVRPPTGSRRSPAFPHCKLALAARTGTRDTDCPARQGAQSEAPNNEEVCERLWDGEA